MESRSPTRPESDGNGRPAGPTPIPWDQFQAEFLALYAPPMRASKTLGQMRQIVEEVASLGVATTAELTPELVARFIASLSPTLSPNTVYGMVARLRVVCNYAAGRGYVHVSPFALRKNWVRRVPVERKRHHTREEIARVLTLMRRDVERKTGWARWRARRLYTLAATVAYTGLRKNEALYLRVEDVDFESRMLLIHSKRHRLKTERSAQPVPIPEALVPILAEWIPCLAVPESLTAAAVADAPRTGGRLRRPGKPDPSWMFPNAYRTGPWIGGSHPYKPITRMKILGKRAGVEGFTFLSLRHSWATHAEYWGLSDAIIQRVLRHTTVRTQECYRHADLENMRAKLGGIGFGNDLAGVEEEAGKGADSIALPVTRPKAPASPSPAIDRGPKLDDADVAEIRELRARGWTYKALCARFGVCKSTLHAAIHHVTHRQAPPAPGEHPPCS